MNLKSKLVSLVLGIAMVGGVAFGADAGPGALAKGQLTEWHTYLDALSDKYYPFIGGSNIAGYPGMIMDTVLFAIAETTDSFVVPGGGKGHFPFVWASDEVFNFCVKVYNEVPMRGATATSILLVLPDSACFYAPVEFSKLVFKRVTGTADTGTAMNLSIVYLPNPPMP